jgi:hypothetical protein
MRQLRERELRDLLGVGGSLPTSQYQAGLLKDNSQIMDAMNRASATSGGEAFTLGLATTLKF